MVLYFFVQTIVRRTCMLKADFKKINVNATFAGFRDKGIFKRITPHHFSLSDGRHHEIVRVRTSYKERVGDTNHVHFVVETSRGQYFDIVYDSKDMTWYMVLEVENNLFFND